MDLDWLIDISHQITELDLSANCLTSLPSVVPWGLVGLQKLNLSGNCLSGLPEVPSSDGILCTKYVPVSLELGPGRTLGGGESNSSPQTLLYWRERHQH